MAGSPPEWDLERFLRGNEVDTAVVTVDCNRRTFASKCADVDADGLRRRLGASAMTLGGLLKHLALVEEPYFQGRLAGRHVMAPSTRWIPRPTGTTGPGAQQPMTTQMCWMLWVEAVHRSRDVLAEALARGGLGETTPDGTGPRPRGIHVRGPWRPLGCIGVAGTSSSQAQFTVHFTDTGRSRPLPEDVGRLLAEIGELLSDELHPVLTGLYLHGSLVAGDYAPGRSDVDLAAVLSVAPDDELLVPLGRVHDEVSDRFPSWRGRVEVEYVALDTLRRASTGDVVQVPSMIARISPGEHLHLLPATPHRLLGWSLIRRYGRPLIGPATRQVIPPMSAESVKAALLHHVRDWPVWVREMATAGGQAYAVLSICRAAVLFETDEQVSKKAAATHAAQAAPGWADLVLWARDWWYEGGSDDEPARTDEVRRFVDETSARLMSIGSG